MKVANEICRELQATIQQVMDEYHAPIDDKNNLTTTIVAVIFKKFGGCTIYFPKNYSLAKQERDCAIVAAANGGMPITRLSQHFNLSRTTIYHVLRTHRLHLPK